MIDPDAIDKTARLMCQALGVDGDEELVCGLMETMTPAERAQRARVGRDANPSTRARRWQTYRHTAAVALAGHLCAKALQV